MEFLRNIYANYVSKFVSSLSYMGEGMLCIFIVIGVIILSIYGMNSLSAKLEERNKSDNQE